MLSAYLMEKYGPRLTVEQLAIELDRKNVQTVYNQIAAGTFPVPTYLEGRNRYADVRDVVAYLDEKRKGAA